MPESLTRHGNGYRDHDRQQQTSQQQKTTAPHKAATGLRGGFAHAQSSPGFGHPTIFRYHRLDLNRKSSPMTSRILALDLATVTGWAALADGTVTSGAYHLGRGLVGTTPTQSPEAYWSDLRDWLAGQQYSALVIERGFHRGAASTYLGGLVYTARMAAYDRQARFVLAPSATWRKAARTIAAEHGHQIAPRAAKGEYHAVAVQMWPDVSSGDEADARWLLEWYRRTP